MEKSTILRVLGNKVTNYVVQECTENKLKFLHVWVKSLNFIEIDSIVENVLNIFPEDKDQIEIIFDSEVIID